MAVEASAEVKAALAAGAPVVALESSIVAHGFPRPENLDLAFALHAAVRQEGAVPAMAAVLDGRCRLGLDDAAIRRLAEAPGVVKCSVRDLAFAVATGQSGGTTVAATARLAAALRIKVFATGGIGGVHRRLPGATGPADVSADLAELARAPIAVVASGAKSILDLPATLEQLETLSVPVIGFGTSEFPAFHSRESGLALSQRVDDAAACARVIASHWALGLQGGVLVCNPPPEAEAMDAGELDRLIAAALAEAAKEKVQGGAVTPFLLAWLDRASGGRTRVVNRALALANARLAARLACALAG